MSRGEKDRPTPTPKVKAKSSEIERCSQVLRDRSPCSAPILQEPWHRPEGESVCIHPVIEAPGTAIRGNPEKCLFEIVQQIIPVTVLEEYPSGLVSQHVEKGPHAPSHRLPTRRNIG